MTNSEDRKQFRSYDELPLVLNATDLINLLGLSRTTVYYMLRADDFPTILIGNRRMVRKDRLFQWLDEHENSKSK